MNSLVEVIDLVDGEGGVVENFSNLKYFQEFVEKPQLNYYTFNYPIIMKNDKEIKKYILEYVKKYENPIIEDNIKRAQINTRSRGDAFRIVNKFREEDSKDFSKVNKKLGEIYFELGFGK